MQTTFSNANNFGNPFFIGIVENNQDPLNSYRVKVRIQNLHHDGISTDQLPWAAKVDTSFMGISNDADLMHAVPEVGTQVLVLAIANDPNSLVYLGNLYKNTNQTPKGDGYLNNYGIYTKKGEFIGVEKIKGIFHMIWKGDLTLDVEGKIKIGSQATQPAVLGNDLTSLITQMIATFNAHTHTGNLSIPTSPPASPMVQQPFISKKITVE